MKYRWKTTIWKSSCIFIYEIEEGDNSPIKSYLVSSITMVKWTTFQDCIKCKEVKFARIVSKFNYVKFQVLVYLTTWLLVYLMMIRLPFASMIFSLRFPESTVCFLAAAVPFAVCVGVELVVNMIHSLCWLWPSSELWHSTNSESDQPNCKQNQINFRINVLNFSLI